VSIVLRYRLLLVATPMSRGERDTAERLSLDDHDNLYGPPNQFIEPDPQIPYMWDTATTGQSYVRMIQLCGCLVAKLFMALPAVH
jgi:hypothetical protein